MKRKLWAEDIAHAMALRDAGVPWKLVARDCGVSSEEYIYNCVRVAKRTGFKHYPSRFGITTRRTK